MKEKPRLVEGRFMTCPRCKKKQDLLTFVPMMTISEYDHDTCPIYKCSLCKWLFAPSDNLMYEVLSQRMKLVPLIESV